ncbi:MAG: hypothetical protein JNK85_28250 [Verrucomicrobiales bacterium]|nr:hypothetical protein [Verrucomicrobiales bacterium]
MPDRTRLEAFMADRGLVYHLAQRVRQEIRRVGSAFKLRTRIIKVCEAAGMSEKINVHVLKGLQHLPERTHLTLPQLVALHLYFSTRSGGLDKIPIFSRRRLLDALQEQSEITVLIAAKSLVRRQTHYTRWDSRALNTTKSLLLRRFQEFGREVSPPPAIDEVDVLLRPEGKNRPYAADRWHRLIVEDRRTLISIGSPRASLASELLLASMFGVKPFGDRTVTVHDPRLPFQFVWPPDRSFPAQSTFALEPKDIAKQSARLSDQVRRGGSAAIAYRHQFLAAPASHAGGWDTFGVLCAQHRPNGNLWVVLSGLSGPATLAAAEVLAEIEPEPPPATGNGAPPPVLWGLVEARLTEDPASPEEADNRLLNRARLLHDAQLFSVRLPGNSAAS